MSELKHTPLPWRRNHRKDYGGVWRVYGPPHPVDGGDCAPLCEFSNPADADLVLAAVNSHYELLGALESLFSNPYINLGDMVYRVRERELQGWDGPAVKQWSDAVMAARAAIAKAKGENHD